MPEIADRLKNVTVSASVAMTQKARDLAAQGIAVIGLSTGEPDFPTPPHAIEAAYAAALAGDTRYPPTDGTPALRAAIQRKFKRDNHLDYEISQIITAGGAKQIIFNAMLATINPGDEVLIPTPSWISYADIVKFAGGVPVPVPCPQENGFKPYPAEIEKAITPKTKWLLLNYPSNPTGSVASRQELQAIADVMLRHPDIWILTDDIYEHLIYDGITFYTIAEVEPRLITRTLTVNGVSKAWSMTGWRLGFCGGPQDLIKAMSNVNTQNSGGVATLTQAASVAALDGPQDLLKERAEIYRQRRDYVLERLASIDGLLCHKPQGAFYLFVNIAAFIGKTSREGHVISSDTDFVLALMEEQHVVTVQGAAYGMSPFFRLSYATSMEILQEGCDRIAAFCAGIR
ncbi:MULTISPECIES: pyridoxal phosphate-dependent aminotransferase [unclassified Brenneria]|uniref:pyridoxal phosphate-dependent aminotransferase n=1 Tax=unclassified Brenneria TaxID=2634434 RepID=UPI0029C19B91|nr:MULTISPECIES: pyridoxal phosphate-dependent aminotransferase [unclassified Brenneria]MDX5629410.1 pyridoxal phosphate-dependent aminotransferase [Brenneria sp. L3-3Z]MDX5696427.1 pyridoxal phosphate-dependent aminotransferase [Brenneria sp. L4-2C]